jgi:hypothetical protein
LLKFREFNTECAFDYLKVYDGSSKNKLLGSFSGSTKPPNLFSNTSAVSRPIQEIPFVDSHGKRIELFEACNEKSHYFNNGYPILLFLDCVGICQ